MNQNFLADIFLGVPPPTHPPFLNIFQFLPPQPPLKGGDKATKHGVAFGIGLAAKLLRMRSKATKDHFAICIGTAAKLLRKCSKE